LSKLAIRFFSLGFALVFRAEKAAASSLSLHSRSVRMSGGGGKLFSP